MNANFVLLFCTALTVCAYVLSRKLAKRHPSPLTTPVFFSTLVIIIVLYATGLDYKNYQPAGDLMILLLGPATVALAVPIYRNRETLRAHILPALVGIVSGSVATVVTVLVLSAAFGFTSEITRSMSVKSVTAPIAIELGHARALARRVRHRDRHDRNHARSMAAHAGRHLASSRARACAWNDLARPRYGTGPHRRKPSRGDCRRRDGRERMRDVLRAAVPASKLSIDPVWS